MTKFYFNEVNFEVTWWLSETSSSVFLTDFGDLHIFPHVKFPFSGPLVQFNNDILTIYKLHWGNMFHEYITEFSQLRLLLNIFTEYSVNKQQILWVLMRNIQIYFLKGSETEISCYRFPQEINCIFFIKTHDIRSKNIFILTKNKIWLLFTLIGNSPIVMS